MDDPRYQKYIAELLRQGISRKTAESAAIVRMESEDQRARFAEKMSEYKRGKC